MHIVAARRQHAFLPSVTGFLNNFSKGKPGTDALSSNSPLRSYAKGKNSLWLLNSESYRLVAASLSPLVCSYNLNCSFTLAVDGRSSSDVKYCMTRRASWLKYKCAVLTATAVPTNSLHWRCTQTQIVHLHDTHRFVVIATQLRDHEDAHRETGSRSRSLEQSISPGGIRRQFTPQTAQVQISAPRYSTRSKGWRPFGGLRRRSACENMWTRRGRLFSSNQAGGWCAPRRLDFCHNSATRTSTEVLRGWSSRA